MLLFGPTGTRKSTVFPLAITHWSEQVEGLQQGLTICAQPRRILAQQLCERVRSNRKMHYRDRTVGYMIARESSKDSSTKLLYCTEAIVALKMQTNLASSAPPLPHELITTVKIDKVHNRSACVLALALAAMQKNSDLLLVLMSATGDHNLVRERIPYCQQLVIAPGAMKALKLGACSKSITMPFIMLCYSHHVVHLRQCSRLSWERSCHCDKGILVPILLIECSSRRNEK